MNDERIQILEMLATGKINVAEAQMLLAALEKATAPEPEALKAAQQADQRPPSGPFGPGLGHLFERLSIPRPPRPPRRRH